MTLDGRQEVDDTFRAHLHALLGAGTTTERLAALHADARRCLGATHEVTLLIECHLSEQRGRSLPAEEAMAAGTDLFARARAALPANHPALRPVTSHLVRCLNRRGHPGDLDHVVALRRAELRPPGYDGTGTDWVGLTRTQLAAALLARGRFGRLDPGAAPGAEADIAAARELIELEVSRRPGLYGAEHPFTWRAHALRCELLTVLAARAAGAGGRAEREARTWAGEAVRAADALARYEWERAGCHTTQALYAQLWRAEALLVLGQAGDAEREARLASVLARRYHGPEVGDALLVLARALAGRDPGAALATAEAALVARLGWFSPGGYQVTEAKLVIAALAGGSAHSAGDRLVEAVGS